MFQKFVEIGAFDQIGENRVLAYLQARNAHKRSYTNNM